MIDREIISGDQEIKKLFNVATAAGYNLIELVWRKFSPSNQTVTGFEIPVVSQSGSHINEVDFATDVKLIIGTTTFFADANNRCWAYVIDTEYNRKKLIQNIPVGWYLVVDQRLRKELEETAKQEGLQSEYVAPLMFGPKKTKAEETLAKQLAKAEIERQEMEMKIKKLEELLVNNVTKREMAEATKPLAGVRIKKDDVLKDA